MTDNERDHLRTELEHGKALITQSRKLIAGNRAGIADAEKHFADSFDQLAESQKPMARKRASIADAEKHFADSFDRLADSQKLARG